VSVSSAADRQAPTLLSYSALVLDADITVPGIDGHVAVTLSLPGDSSAAWR
jgi:hypothetical protein